MNFQRFETTSVLKHLDGSQGHSTLCLPAPQPDYGFQRVFFGLYRLHKATGEVVSMVIGTLARFKST